MSGIDPDLVSRARSRLSKYTSRGGKKDELETEIETDTDVLTVDRPFEPPQRRYTPEPQAERDATDDRPRRTPQREESGKLLSALGKAIKHPMADYGFLLGTAGLLMILGLVMVLSASTVMSLTVLKAGSYSIFFKQLMFAGVGLTAMFVASRMPVTFFRRLATPLLVLSGITLVLVLVPGVGVEVNGQQNWLSFGGPFQFQPSEFAKIALTLWCAECLFRNRDRLDTMRGLLVPLLPVAGGILFLVLLEKDLGTCFVLIPILAAMLFVAGAPRKIFAWGGVGFVGLIIAMTIAAPYRAARFASWLNPDANADGIGYQVIHGQYALATGGWWGVGLGASREKWGFLPEAHTDFILAVIGEELGLIGTLSVLGLFALLGWVIVQIALKSDSLFVRLATAGIGTWLIIQAIVNIGAVLGILPIVGVPLPLVSYGGSSLIFSLTAIGVLLAFARSQPDARKFIRERKAAKLSSQGRRTRNRPSRRPEQQSRTQGTDRERPKRPSRIRPNDAESQTAAAEAPRRTLRRGTAPPPPEPIQESSTRRTSRRRAREDPDEIDLRETMVFEQETEVVERPRSRSRREPQASPPTGRGERAKQPSKPHKGESTREPKPKRGWKSRRDLQAEERAAAEREAEAARAAEEARSSRSARSRRQRKDRD